jgi:trk system potassium uptake protein TrkA
MCHHDTRVEAGDHVIVFVTSKRLVPQVEKLFQVSASFL